MEICPIGSRDDDLTDNLRIEYTVGVEEVLKGIKYNNSDYVAWTHYEVSGGYSDNV